MQDINGSNPEDIAKAVEFSFQAVKKPLVNGVASSENIDKRAYTPFTGEIPVEELNPGEAQILMMVQDIMDDYHAVDVHHGLSANLVRGEMGLKKKDLGKKDNLGKLMAEAKPVENGVVA